MIAVDTNLLVYSHQRQSPHYLAAYRCIAGLASGQQTWAIPWPCIHEFLAVVTRRGPTVRPAPLTVALEQVSVWMESPTLVVLGETPMHWPVLSELLVTARAAGGLVHDARIAALCREHGVTELWTADRDFARFPGLRTFNPLHDDSVHEQRPGYGAAVRARTEGRRRAAAQKKAISHPA
ncbi:MAG TPA: TA system VapC family ribonuclease toxin [Candidatus Binatia bacterium]|nr:TA system VapC family ribonuclease toxin [Candidatus Binatia bacterium]